MVFPKRCLKAASTQYTRKSGNAIAYGGGRDINASAAAGVPTAAVGVHAAAATGVPAAAAEGVNAATAARGYTDAPDAAISDCSFPATTRGFFFKHPFTANISGPTCCGKTYICKMLLQHCLKMIWPPPERIVCLYKRWQPLYDVTQSTVYPKVEFIQGIPFLDDLMSTASEDSRINKLFTEGSHCP